MPLFRIQTRTKSSSEADAPRVESSRARRAQPAAGGGSSSLLPALAVGGFLGLLIIGGVSALILRQAPPPAAPAPAQGALGNGAVPGDPASGAQPLAPGPINADYARDIPVAMINNQPYLMSELETAVRVSRTLGKLSGDPVPNYGDAEMKAFQVQILKRQIDMRLIKQAMLRDGLAAPTGPVDDLITAFLQKVGVTDAMLAAELAANSATRADLQKWFDDSRAINFYLQSVVMAGKDQEQRDVIVAQWLSEEWKRNEDAIGIHFYDPDDVRPAQANPPAGAGATVAPATPSQP